MQDSNETPASGAPSAPSSDAAAPSETPNPAHGPQKTWEELGLSESALELIRKAGFSRPTPVQSDAIPYALDGHDVIASAQTGSGKTAAFVLPLVEKFAGREGTYGLILAPTREIAQQTQATIDLFGTPRGIRSIVLIGGIDMKLDAKAIQTYPQIIVATPGRLCDHLDRGNIWLDFIEMVVLDEADRMLDMGFSDQLSRIMEDVPRDRQTMLFSATFTPTVENLARKILFEPKRVAIGKTSSAAKTVEQRLVWVAEEGKNRELRRLLREETGSIIVFTRSKDKATRVWRSLHSAGVYDATYIHSDRLQSHREQALAEFKDGKYRILIATDVAGRGIHVDGVAHVINYDLPMEPEDYVHRIGRTGRAGASGRATTFATQGDRGIVRRIEKIIGHAIPAQGHEPGGDDQDRAGGRGRGRDSRPQGQQKPLPSRSGPSPIRVQSPTPGQPPLAVHAQGPAQGQSLDPGTRNGPRPQTGEGQSSGGAKKRRRRRGGRGRSGGGGGGGGGGSPQGPSGSSPQGSGGRGGAFPV